MPYHVKWEEFGDNIDLFFDREESRLREGSYNIIMGFTRGGAILANILASKLTDLYPEYSKPSMAAVRTIPSGIYNKTYDSPDFVMAGSCADEDRGDLDKLIREIIDFKQTFGLSEVRSILVDDNLTGSTRMRLFQERLLGLEFLHVDLLAYTRNPVFFVPDLDYAIKEDPEPISHYVSMPWHKVHEARGLDTHQSELRLRLFFTAADGTTLKGIEDALYQHLLPDKLPMESRISGDVLLIKRGETYTMFKLVGTTLQMKFSRNMFYPPKGCLNRDPPVFGEHSLCRLGGDSHTSLICSYCSALTCSKDIIGIIERNIGCRFEFAGLFLGKDKMDSSKVDIDAVETWMRNPSGRVWDLRYIELGSFLDLDEEEQVRIKNKIKGLFKSWIDEQFDALDAIWIVTMGDEVVAHSRDLRSIPELEQMLPLAKERGQVPFLFIRQIRVEEIRRSEWSDCGEAFDGREDWYPTIDILVSGSGMHNDGRLEFRADFDTGNPYIHLDGDTLVMNGIVRRPTYYDLQENTHADVQYSLYWRTVEISILGGDPAIEPFESEVVCVKDWDRSPFKSQYTNPQRTALVGRQVFRYRNLRTVLDGPERTTRCEGR